MKDHPSIKRLENISHAALESLDPKKTMVIVAVSPIEAHGPHLPLGQDWFEAIKLMEGCAAKAVEKHDGWTALIVPSLPLGCDTIPHFGSVNYPPHIVRDVAYYALRPFAKKGFARLAYSSFHGGPRHFCALEDAADKLTRNYGVAAMSFFSVVASRMSESNIFYDAVKDLPDNPMTSAQIEADLHGGFIETSIALHLFPELVEDGWQNLADLASEEGDDPHKDLLFGGGPADIAATIKKTISGINAAAGAIRHYKKHNYAGYPSKASAEMGARLLEHLQSATMEIIDEFMEKGKKMNVHSPVWGLRNALLSPAAHTVLEEWLGMYSG